MSFTCVMLPPQTAGTTGANGHNGRHRNLQERQQNQNQRIGNGVLNGKLDTQELCSLREQRHDYRQEVKEARGDDGRIDRQERFALNQDLNAMSESIFAFKHN